MKDSSRETYQSSGEKDSDVEAQNGSLESKRKESSEPKDIPESEGQSQNDVQQLDPNLVTWDEPNDPENPKNWSFAARWRVTAIASAFTFIAPVSTTMTAPALVTIAQDLNINRPFYVSLTLSIFVLAYALGPFVSAPLSEIYGRRSVLQLFNLVYLAFNTACGFARTGPQLIACRFFAGFGGRYVQLLSWSLAKAAFHQILFAEQSFLGDTVRQQQ
ncbi:MAG: hypothetical protein Q9177_003974 [Variospora cf. flavescens]